eukprot:jgi/Mesvir1/11784/Mv00151-RA.1
MQKPEGWGGNLMTQYMSTGNRELAIWAVKQLNLSLHDRVLNIGPGSGYETMMTLRELNGTGFVAAVDHSELALNLTSGRNPESRLHTHHLDLSTSRLPYNDGVFDKAFSVDSLPCGWWAGSPGPALADVLRVIKPGGSLVVTCYFRNLLMEMLVSDRVGSESEPLADGTGAGKGAGVGSGSDGDGSASQEEAADRTDADAKAALSLMRAHVRADRAEKQLFEAGFADVWVDRRAEQTLRAFLVIARKPEGRRTTHLDAASLPPATAIA